VRWETQRRTLAPLFARRPVASFAQAMLEAAEHLSARWQKLTPAHAIDVVAEVTLLTLNVLALTIFSDGIGGDYDEFRSAMSAYFDAIGRIGLFDLLRVPSFVPLEVFFEQIRPHRLEVVAQQIAEPVALRVGEIGLALEHAPSVFFEQRLEAVLDEPPRRDSLTRPYAGFCFAMV
jgi:cytochrome P450